MPHRERLVAGAVALAVAGALAVAPTSTAAAAPMAPVTSYASTTGACDVTLPGGTHAVVTERNGRQTARLTDATAARTGMLSLDNGGDDVLLPATQLSAVANGSVNIAYYDTALLAQRDCGWDVPQAHHSSGGYQLGRLTIHTIGLDGKPSAGLVMLTNVDNQNLARPIVDTTNGITKIAVPDGHYAALLAYQVGLYDYRFVMVPDVTLHDGASITLDARTATVTARPPTTPKPATLESSSFGVSRGDGVNAADWFDYFNLDPTPASFSINPLPVAHHGVQVVNPDYESTSPATATSPYQYHITEPVDHVSGGFPTAVHEANLATVTRHYDAQQAGGYVLSANIGEPRDEAAPGLFGLRGLSLIATGVTTTEYFTASPDLVWLSVEDGDAVSRDEIFTSPTIYLPGHHTTETFHQGAEHPGPALDTIGAHVTCAACSADGNLQFDLYPFNDNTPGHYAILDNSSSASFSLSRNGSLIASANVGAQFVGVPVPSGNARYQLTENVNRSVSTLPLSTSSQTTWTFTANPGHGRQVPAYWSCPNGGQDCSPLPLLFAYYTTDSTATDGLTAGRHTLNLDVQHQQRANAPEVTGASVAVSYDDGATWVPAPVGGHDGRFTASFTVPATTNGYVAVRVSAWDAAGNRIDQTVQRAYGTGTPAAAATSSAARAPVTGTTATQPIDVCANPQPGFARCLAQAQGGGRHKPSATRTPNGATSLPAGYGPADLQSAYNLTSAIKAGAGKGATVAVVDGYDDPTAEADLAGYRSTYGLPPCTTANGCFQKVNEQGKAAPLPAANGNWATEISLDLDAVSAACPGCRILLVEANVPSFSDLATAENTAVSLGAVAVSNSYSTPETAYSTRFASAYDHPGVAITASSGDTGYQLAAGFPADLPTVTAVGGTTLHPAQNERGWTETAWALNAKGDAAGSGCSAWFDKPSWQRDTACPGRTIADVSADADPHTGFAVYDTTPNPLGLPTGWLVVGGTSASSPFVAGVYALAGNTGTINGASHLYAHQQHLYDVVGGSASTAGANEDCPVTSYVCTGVVGYDGPTGLGTPNGPGAF